MSSKTGIDVFVCRYEESTAYPLGMHVVNCKIKKLPLHNKTENGTGTRRASSTSTGFHYEIKLKCKAKRLSNFVNTYAFVTAEGDAETFNLYVDDGNVERGFTGCLVDKATINGQQSGVIMVDLTIKSITDESKSLTISEVTDDNIDKTGVTTLTVGGVSQVDNWTKFSLSVDNHVEVVCTGSGHAATIIYAKEATYSGQIEYVKTSTHAFGWGSTTNSLSIVYGFTDNQSVPVVTTYTFSEAKCEGNEWGNEELDLVYETLNWQGTLLTIT